MDREALKSMLERQRVTSEIHLPLTNDMPLLEGELSFDTLPSGVNVHCCDSVEKQNASSSAELPPCISINILLEGKVSFKLGNEQYLMDKKGDVASLFINVTGRTEVFTRYLVEDQRVRKVNVSIDKQWLLYRCQSAQERFQIESLFNQGTQVFQPNFPRELLKLSNNLMGFKQQQNFDGKIQAEHITLNIIAICVPLVLEGINKKLIPDPQVSKKNMRDDEFFRLFNVLALQDMSLSNIAINLGVSVSTLQRKVKNKYQLTAIEYVRYKKLDKAKASLVIDGLSIGEIAFNAGYSHVSNFVTAFKKRFNMTPTQFREGHIYF